MVHSQEKRPVSYCRTLMEEVVPSWSEPAKVTVENLLFLLCKLELYNINSTFVFTKVGKSVCLKCKA